MFPCKRKKIKHKIPAGKRYKYICQRFFISVLPSIFYFFPDRRPKTKVLLCLLFDEIIMNLC